MKKISNILIVTSTNFEVENLVKYLYFESEKSSSLKLYSFRNLKIDILISGIGMSFTTYSLTKALSEKKYELVLNIGICGSFINSLPVGEVVNVVSDEFADLGITEADDSFKTLFDEKFINKNHFPFKYGKLISNPKYYNFDLPKVNGITVNSTSGSAEQIKKRKEKFNVDIETMEGAAVAYVCLNEGLNFMQIRAISNLIERRNKDNWNMPLAISNLSESVIDILKIISR